MASAYYAVEDGKVRVRDRIRFRPRGGSEGGDERQGTAP